MKAYLALIKIDLKLAMRQRSVIFFNYLFPMIFFFVFAQAYRADQGGMITQVVTMVSVIGILGNGLFGAGMRAVQERENNILRRYKVAPISAAPLLVASMVTGLLTYLPYLLLMLLLAHFRYGMVFPPNIFSVMLFASFGLIAFRAIGLTVASVVNSVQESAILTQVLYISMLFLSGASFPLTLFPKWLLTVTQFIPATYLVSGLQSIILRRESIFSSLPAVGALTLTTVAATFVSVKLFRWEKEEKIKTSAKLWLLAVLAPFLVMGAWQAHSQDNVVKTRVLARALSRSRSILIRNARIFTGDGKVIESGAVLIREGKIAEIYDGTAPDPKVLKAEVMEGAGKTVVPGMIDVDVHLGESGGISGKPLTEKQMQRELAEYLYCGITAVEDVGDTVDRALQLGAGIDSGERLGAQVFAGAVLRTLPGKPQDALHRVDELQRKGVNGIWLTWDGSGHEILRDIATEGRRQKLVMFLRLHAKADAAAGAADVEAVLKAGIDAVEGDVSGEMPAAMSRLRVSYLPALRSEPGTADPGELSRPLVLQTAPPEVLAAIRKEMVSGEFGGGVTRDSETAGSNLLRAWKAGVTLVTGSGAGRLLVLHGPTIQRELELWVEAGIPNDAALQAATWNAAKLLHAEQKFGAIRKGLEATLVVVEGNPLSDIHAMSSISSVIFKGERVSRSSLFDEE